MFEIDIFPILGMTLSIGGTGFAVWQWRYNSRLLFYRVSAARNWRPGRGSYHVALWNAGFREIRGKDLRGLKIVVEDRFRIQAREIHCQDSTGVTAEPIENSDSSLRLSFDYLNSGDGTLVTVLVISSNPEMDFQTESPISIVGSIVGGKAQNKRPSSYLFLLVLLPFMIVTQIGIFSAVAAFPEWRIVLAVAGGLLVPIVGVLATRTLRRWRMPQHLYQKWYHVPSIEDAI